MTHLLQPIPCENTTTGQCPASSGAPRTMGMVSCRPAAPQPSRNSVEKLEAERNFLAAGRSRNSELLTQVGQFQVMASRKLRMPCLGLASSQLGGLVRGVCAGAG